MIRLVIAASVAVIAACGTDETSFQRDMRRVCSAPARYAAELAAVSPVDRMASVARRLAMDITDKEVRGVLGQMAGSVDKVAVLTAAARRAGIDRCQLLDLWAEPHPVQDYRSPDPAAADTADQLERDIAELTRVALDLSREVDEAAAALDAARTDADRELATARLVKLRARRQELDARWTQIHDRVRLMKRDDHPAP